MPKLKLKQPQPSAGRKILPPHGTEVNLDKQKPVFSFEYMQSSHCVEKCTRDEKAALASTLYKLSQLTWEDIKKSHRHGTGFEKISREAIREPIPNAVTPEVNLIAFRFCGKAPMIGFRTERIFHVLWLDRNFNVFDVLPPTHVAKNSAVFSGILPLECSKHSC